MTRQQSAVTAIYRYLLALRLNRLVEVRQSRCLAAYDAIERVKGQDREKLMDWMLRIAVKGY